MIINTTVNIETIQYEKIKCLAVNTGQSISGIINHLLKVNLRAKIKSGKIQAELFSPVKYQSKKENRKEWIKLHISFEKLVYESSIDYRNLYKISVSALVNELINNSNIAENQGNIDNYLFNYNLETFFNQNSHVFTVITNITLHKTG